MKIGYIQRLIALLVFISPFNPFAAITVQAQAWYNSNWQYRQKITISSNITNSDLSDFPYLVQITDSGNPAFASAQSDGDDILFTAADGTTKLDHEREKYSNVTDELFCWVRIPTLSASSDTEIFMYYGHDTVGDQQNPAAVWDSDFVMVQHLQETSGTHFDSAGSNDGTPSGGVNQNVTGKIDGADQLDGNNDVVNIANSTSLQVVEMTLEAWVYIPDSVPTGFHGIVQHATSTNNWYGLWNNGSNFHFRWSTGSVRRTDFAATIAPDNWYYVVGVLNPGASAAYTYLNGNIDRTIGGPSSPTPAAGTTHIGSAFNGTSEFFKGFVDEVRVSSRARSADWIKATYRNVEETGSYQSLAGEETDGPDTGPPAAITDLATGTVTTSSIQLTWTAPGDDGNSGTAAAYDIRYSTSPITALNWDSASQAIGEPAPQSAGSAEIFVMTGLSGNTNYYFAIKTADEVPNWSVLSNVPSGSTTAGTNSNGECGVLYEEFSEAKSNDIVTSITVLKPGGTSYGDLLIAAVAVEKDNQSSLSAPAGWSLINVNAVNDKATLGVWYKIAGAAEPASYQFTWSDDVNAYAWIMRFTGHDMTAPIDTWAGGSGKSQWPTSPSVTTTVENTMILRLGAFEGDEITVDSPGLAGHTAITMDSDNHDGKVSGGAGYLDQAATGASGTSTFTLTGENEYRNVTVAIAPDPDCMPSPDIDPPAAVTDLTAGSSTSSSVLLSWTAPGDDGSSGTATSYDIRYSTSPITALNWDSASQAIGEPAPQSAGSAEIFVMTGLSGNTNYYFAIKTADEVPNWSVLSNVPSGSTTAGTNSNGECGVLYEEFSEAKANDNVSSLTVLKPGGTSYGDLLIAAVAVEKDFQSSLSAPAGWTLINVNAVNDKATLGVWYKIAGAAEPASYQFTWSADECAYAWIMRFTGHDMTTPINTWAGGEGQSQWPTSPSVTTTVENTMILRLGAFEGNEITVDSPGLAGHTAITMDSDNHDGKVSGGAGYLDQAATGASGTSTFTLTGENEYRNVTVAIAPDPDCSTGIEGAVWEDINGDASLGDAVGRPNVTVKLYRDGGDGLPNGSDDSLQGTTTTQVNGSYIFASPSDGDYWVVVDSRTITPTDGYNGGFALGDIWAEQTYGPIGGLRDDGAGGTIELVTAGSCFGGRDTERSDDASALGTAEHVAKITVAGAGASNVDFGFSFNAITRTGDGDDDGANNRTIQGSLRQFIQNSNAIVGTNSSHFAISTHDSGYNLGGFGEYRVQPTSALPTVADPISLDATTQTGFVDKPLIEIDGSGAGANISGLTITAGSSTVRGLVINRFTGSGLRLEILGGNTIVGNYIGPDAGGMTGGVGNVVDGIYIYQSPNNVIGGTTATDRNIISGNRLRGIWINEVDDGPGASSAGTEIRGNYIGTNADGTDKLPYSGGGTPTYQQIGIALWDAIGNTIGGTAVGAGNVLSGNSMYGIYFWGPNSGNNAVQGNIIGLDESATNPIGNGWDTGVPAGVYLSNAPGNTVGGTAAGAGNTIAGNNGSGVIVYGTSSTGNAILGNSIYGNDALGIDLGVGDGITPNDGGDGDTGGNNLQNYPVLTLAGASGGNLTVQGTLNSTASTTYRLEFFANSAVDPSGYGEGETYLGTTNVITDGSGNATIDHTMAVSVASGYFITATATDPANNTSEFSAGQEVVGSADVAITKSDSDDPVASGGGLLYTLMVTNNGPDTATSVTVVDTLPAGVTLQSVAVSQGTWSGTSVITCNLGAILNGGTATVEILVIPTGTGSLTNTALVSASSVDGVSGNNSDTETTLVVADGTTDIPLTLYHRVHGFVDFTTTGGSLRTQPNGVDPCAVTTSSSATLAGIPATATVQSAYLYWAASGSVIDDNVTLDGSGLTADRTWMSTYVMGASRFDFFGGFKDVTTQVQTKGNGNYTFSGLSIDTGAPYCASAAVLGGWSLIVVYEDPALTGKTLVVYDGFDLERNGSTNYLLSGIYASDPPEAKTAFLVWEGDDTLGGTTESLEFNGTAQSDALNPVNNIYNGTINTSGTNNSYGLDLDTFDVSPLVNFGDTFATTTLMTGPDLVILNAVVLEAKTNVIAGSVFEDVNFGGGAGRDLAQATTDAPGFSVGRPNATVELYDGAGNFFRSTTSSADGAYGFAGLADGNYFVRVVNETVTSSRDGATGLESPVQTYRTDGSTGTTVPVTAEVGGAYPTLQDGPVNATSENLSDITAQSVTPVLLSAAFSVINVDFGYNFDTIVNTNESGQGSLRQFLINSNALENTDLDQDGLTVGLEASIFQIPTTDPGYNRTGNGEYSILPVSPLTTVTDPVMVTGTTQPGFTATPIIELDGTNAGAGAAGLTISGGGSTVQSLAINRFNGSGIELSGGDANTVVSCYIGSDVTGAVDLGNTERGVWIRTGSSDNIIGGNTAGAGNIIAYNGTIGVGLEAGAGTGNAILGNSIFGSGNLAIDLAEDGFTANDKFDADTGVNGLQNFPVVTSARSDGATVHILGSLDAAINSDYRIEFFANLVVHPSGYGEGRTYLGYADVTTNGSGLAAINVTITTSVPIGDYISATATGPDQSTSEFGDNSIVLGIPDILILKSVSTLSDPINATTNPKAIPGAIMLYTIVASNQGDGPVDDDSVVVLDVVPANTTLFVGDVDAPGSGPVVFEDGSTASGLSYAFTALGSTTDDIEFSNDNGATYDYTPIADAEGYDPDVTHFRIKPTGVFAGSDGANHPGFSLKFKVRLDGGSGSKKTTSAASAERAGGRG